MSEFDKLKDDAEQYAKDHPDQVREGEQDVKHAAESKFGIGGDQGQGQQGQGNQPGQGNQQGQDSQQGQGDGGQGTGQAQQNQ